MKSLIAPLLCAIVLASSLSSCYRMPTQDDYSLIPTTNNRDFTREKMPKPGGAPF